MERVFSSSSSSSSVLVVTWKSKKKLKLPLFNVNQLEKKEEEEEEGGGGRGRNVMLPYLFPRALDSNRYLKTRDFENKNVDSSCNNFFEKKNHLICK